MSEEAIREGDRFVWLPEGRTVEVQCENGTCDGKRLWLCRYLDGDRKGVGCNCVLGDPRYWRRLPREAASVEERRAALFVGDVITDPAVLCKGMRVYTGVRPSGFDRVVARMSKQVVTFADGGQFGYDSIQRGRQDWERIEFLGWAQEEKAGERTKDMSDAQWDAKRTKPPAGKPDPTPTGLSGAVEAIKQYWEQGVTIVPQAVTGVDWGFDTQPSPPPRGLPFVYVDGCLETHTGVLCLNCESIIGKAMEAQSRYAERPDWKPKPQRPEPHRPSDTGMGGACGPILSRMR